MPSCVGLGNLLLGIWSGTSMREQEKNYLFIVNTAGQFVAQAGGAIGNTHNTVTHTYKE